MAEDRAHYQVNSEADVSHLELLRLIWRQRWLIVAVTVLFAGVGAVYAMLATQWWRAEVVMLQVDSKPMAGGLAQLGGLASLAGINLGGSSGSQNAVAVLKSKDFAREFIEDKDLVQVLLYDRLNEKPSVDIRDAVEFFEKEVLVVFEDKKTGLIRLSVTWINPQVAAEWANELVLRANKRLRDQAIGDADRNIKYLQAELQAANMPTLQQAIGKVVESEMQKMMMARGNTEYSFRVLDGAAEPKKRERPQKALIFLAALLAGFLASAFIIFARDIIKKLK